MALRDARSLLQQAQAALGQADPRRAALLCRELLAQNSRHLQARYFLGLAHALQGDSEAAIAQWQAILELEPRDFPTLVNLGIALAQRGHHAQAIAKFHAALAIDASPAEVHYNLGNSLLASGAIDAAIASFRTAIARNPRFADARNNLGVAYRRAGQLEQARTEFAAAIVANPAHADAHNNLGAILAAEGQVDAAITNLRQAFAYDARCIDAALRLSQLLEGQGRSREALEVLTASAAVNPEAGDLHYARAVALHRAGQLEVAVASYDRAAALLRNSTLVWRGRGQALESLQRLTEALDSYKAAMTMAPEDEASIAGVLSCCVRTCEWALIARTLQELRQMSSGMEAIHPFLSLSVCDEPSEQLRVAAARSRSYLSGERTLVRAADGRHGRVRVAYVSSDLRDHAVTHLLIGALERHNRNDFEIHAVSLQPQTDQSEMGQRLQRAADHFHDVHTRSDSEATHLLRELEIDVAVDLNGYTVGGRPAIFAHRAAPVQVSYLGYAGTLGAPYMDYLIADEVVIPAGEERWYAEQVVRLPHCYLPNDDRREIGAPPTREAAGLPGAGFVFCAFTNAYKINPAVFDVWMRLLRQVPGSVLWLRGMGQEPRANLAREAQARGVESQRLIFAPHVPNMAEHLGRQALADLYLDTLPYNAHSTACDALWAGVPVLTCMGRSMASRVAASAMKAAGLPELITSSLQEYERRALEMARNAGELQALRERLARNRPTAPLFDTAGYTRHLEAAYLVMHQRALNGEPAQGFTVES